MKTKNTTKSQSASTQTVAPPSWTMPGISDAAAKVTSALSGLPGVAYTGDFVAAPDQGLVDKAVGAYGGTADRALALGDLLTGQIGKGAPTTTYSTALPQQNYDMTGVLEASLAPLTKQLQQNVLPGIRSSATDAGAYSGSRALSVLPGIALDNYTKNAGDTLATLGYQNYNDQQNRALQAFSLDTARQQGDASLLNQYSSMLPQLIDTALRTGSVAGDLYGQAATTGLNAEQANINNELAKAQYAYTQPFQGLDIATQLLQALSGNYGTTSSTSSGTQTQTSGGLGAAVQGIAGLGSLAASFSNPFSAAASAGGASKILANAAPSIGSAIGSINRNFQF